MFKTELEKYTCNRRKLKQKVNTFRKKLKKNLFYI